MNMDFKRKLPIPMEIKELYPVSQALKDVKAARDEKIKAVFRGESELTVFGRAISKDLRDQAFVSFTVGTIWVVAVGMILSVIDGEVHELEEVIFETVSAFGTVGMGIGITLHWNDWGKGLLALTMLLGRVGIMTFLLALIKQKKSTVKHPEEEIMIG